MDRISIVKSLVDGGGRGLEIGPSYNPIFPKRDGYAVESVDHAPAAALRAKYAATDVDLTRIEEVDYIWSGEPLETLIPRRHYYDYIFAGHVIEHLPDPLAFFSAAAELLREDGSLVLAVPDKHYCFDCFGRLSSAGEILQAHAERRRRHGAGAIFDHVAYMAAQRGKTSWGPETTGAPDFLHNLDEAVDAHARSAESEAYVDVHAWRFTPSSFRLIFHDLLEAGFVGLREARFHDTVGNEFFIAFGLHGDGCPVDRRTLALRAISEQAAAAQNYGLASLPLGKAKAKAQRSRLPRYY